MKYQTTIKNIMATIITASLSLGVWASGLQANISSSQVTENETFQLTLTAEGNNLTPADLSPLQQDFVIKGTSSASQTSIINGRRQDSVSWNIALSPKKKGVLTIPVIHAGALSSDALQIKVTDISQSPKTIGTTGVALKVELEEGPYYQFQEVPLTLRIETNQPLRQASLLEPQGSGFKLQQVGKDQASQMTRNGQLVTVIERNYMIQFEQGGTLNLPPFVLEGKLIDRNARQRDPFFSRFGFGDSFFDDLGMDPFMDAGKPFRVRSDNIALDVQGKAGVSANSNDWFLPAKLVELTATWADSNPIFEKEKAAVRQITIQALGARPEQIPTLDFSGNADVKIYIDDSASALINTQQGSVAQKILQLSVVPLKAGEITLPEINLKWFNTKTGKEETATLVAETIHVAESSVATPKVTIPDLNSNKTEPIDSEQTLPAVSGSDQDAIHWQRWLILLSLLLICYGLFWWYRKERAEPEQQSKAPSDKHKVKVGLKVRADSITPDSEYLQIKNLLKVVETGDAKKTYKAFSQWFSSLEPSQRSSHLDAQLRELESVLFSPEHSENQWNNKKLKEELKQLAKKRKSSTTSKTLPPLYPTTH